MAQIQQDDLTMVGMGNATATATLPVGVHLRWSFDPTTRGPQSAAGGFILPGFYLYRRAHDAENGVAVDPATEGTVGATGDAVVTFTGASGLEYSFVQAELGVSLPAALEDVVNGNTGQTRVALPARCWKATLTANIGSSGLVRLSAEDGGHTMVTTEVAGPATGAVVTVVFDRFDGLVIEVDNAAVTAIVYVELPTSISLAGWTLIAGPLAPSNDWTVTSARMLAVERPQLDGTTGAGWLSYVAAVNGLYAGDPGAMGPATGDDPLPAGATYFTVAPVQRILMASLDPAIARAAGLLHIDDTVTPGSLYDYLLVGAYTDDTFYWICRRLGTNVASTVPEPVDLTATASRGPTTVDVGTGASRPGGRIQLTWTPPQDGTRLKPGAPVRHLVEFQGLGTGTSADPIDPGAWADPFGGAFAAYLLRRDEDGNILPSLGVAHTALMAGWYGYQIQGIDLFGRATAFIGPATGYVPRDPSPPPPAAVTARYLSEEVSDLTSAESTWVATNGTGVRMRWLWSRDQARQNPDVVEFRIYRRDASADRRIGTIGTVADNADGTATVTTDVNLAAEPGDFEAGWLVASGVRFQIRSHTSTSASSFVVDANQVPDPDTGETEQVLPAAGAALTLMETLRDPLRWDERVYVQDNDLVPVTTTVSTVTEVADGVYDLACAAAALTGEDHAGPGILYDEDQGTRVWAVSHTVSGGDLVTLRVRVATDADGNPENLPDVGDTITYYPAYDVMVPNVTLTATATTGVAVARFAVSSADDDTAVPDDATWASGSWGGRTGNEGNVSAPAVARAVWTTAPSAPTVVELSNNLASPPDFSGKSRFLVTWPDGGTRYHLLRGTVEAILAAYTSGTENDPESYSPEDILTIAAPGSFDTYFVPVNKERIGTESVHGTEVQYEDTLPGTGSNRYLYRLVAEDGAGNRSTASLIPTVAYIPIAPPQTPRIVSTLAGDGTVTVTWQRVRDMRWLSDYEVFPEHRPRVVAYRVYRSTSADDAQDIRLMTLVQSVTPNAAATTESYVDTDVETATLYYYRITAVTQRTLTGIDEEMESAPSALTSGRCYSLDLPAEPTDLAAIVDGGTVQLNWTMPDARSRCLLQRTLPGFDDKWITVGTWLAAGEATASDATVSAGESYTYRLRVRNAVGFELLAATTADVST
jgi:hypothetical protein